MVLLAAAIALTSCTQHAETERVTPLTVYYTIDCSQELIDSYDLIVTYKDKGGADVVDTIKDLSWKKTVVNDKIPVKIGLDFTWVPKGDSLEIEPHTLLHAAYSIIAYEADFSSTEPIINEVISNNSELATIIDIYNERQAYRRENKQMNSCYTVKSSSNGKKMVVKKARWNEDTE